VKKDIAHKGILGPVKDPKDQIATTRTTTTVETKEIARWMSEINDRVQATNSKILRTTMKIGISKDRDLVRFQIKERIMMFHQISGHQWDSKILGEEQITLA
jgi:hypothetical protein